MIRFEDKVCIPPGIDSVKAFRQWVRSPDFPDQGRFAFLAQDLWIDLTMEQIFDHSLVKGCVYATWRALGTAGDLGYCLPDGVLLTNVEVGLGTEPDGMFISYDAVTE